MTELTEDERQGIEAIQFLQAMVGIDETAEDALAGWRKMSGDEKETTLFFYEVEQQR